MKTKTSMVNEKVKEKKKIKLKISDIKKNSSSDVMHTIKRIKLEEKRIVTCLVIGILLIFCVVGIIVFPVLGGNNFDEITSGPLKISFTNTENGISDIVDFTGKEKSFSTKVNISNDSGINSWYAIYLDDYLDMIEYDGCSNMQLNKEDIYFSIDDSYKTQLSSVDYGGRYVLIEDVILADSEITHEIKVWHTGYSNKHYHGKIIVKYLR